MTRRRIFEAALRIVDREGADALSMRRLGRALDVEAMSLYNHVTGRQDVLDGMSEVLIRRIGVGPDTGGWAETLAQFMRGIRGVALAHPSAFELVGMRPLATRKALPPIEVLLEALRGGGFDAEAASHAYRMAASYARGFALAEIGGFTLAEPRVGLRALEASTEEFPNIAALAPCRTSEDRDAAFEFGIQAIVAGLRRLLAYPEGLS